jgi:hypothetical protein
MAQNYFDRIHKNCGKLLRGKWCIKHNFLLSDEDDDDDDV